MSNLRGVRVRQCGQGESRRRNRRDRSGHPGATTGLPPRIYAITRNQQINLAQLLGERFSANRPDELTLQEASRLIDGLKRNQSAPS